MADDQTLRIVQVTDCHLFQQADGQLLGLDTRNSLCRVLDLVAEEYPEPDLILATGDLSQDGSADSYRYLREQLDQFKVPTYWFPGNHDRLEVMQEVLGEGSPSLSRLVRRKHWQIVLLDSTIPGKVPGRLEAGELEFLGQCLEEQAETHTLVSFHHQPVPIDCRWLDPLGVQNAADLFEVTDRFSNVRAILWGHIHQEYDRVRDKVRLLASPSTSVQFKPGSEEFQADDKAPGYRWLELHPDGSMSTGVSRVTGVRFEVDYSVKGY